MADEKPITLDYQTLDRTASLKTKDKIVRVLAGLLAMMAIAVVEWYLAELSRGGRTNFFNSISFLTAAVALALILRMTNMWRHLLYRTAWISSTAVFGLWAAIMISNQTHGRPPTSDHYVIAGCLLSCALSGIGLALDFSPSDP